jgi:hypothetical protein
MQRVAAPSEVVADLAGQPVSIRFAGSDLATRFLPTLDHVLRPAGPDPVLRIGCWDRVASGVPPPAPRWGAGDFVGAGRVRGHVFGGLRIWYDLWSRELQVYDRDRGEAVFHAVDAARVPPWADRSPFRMLLTWWAADRGLALLHAAAVATEGGAVALAGPPGAGKSTTAMACVAAGLRFLGDDCCLVRPAPEPTVFSIYRRAKLEVSALELLPTMPGPNVDVGPDQVVLEPARLALKAPLRALLLPVVTTETRTGLVPVPATESLRTLVPIALAESGGLGTTLLGPLTELVRHVPVFRLRLGRDPAEAAAVVAGVVEGSR